MNSDIRDLITIDVDGTVIEPVSERQEIRTVPEKEELQKVDDKASLIHRDKDGNTTGIKVNPETPLAIMIKKKNGQIVSMVFNKKIVAIAIAIIVALTIIITTAIRVCFGNHDAVFDNAFQLVREIMHHDIREVDVKTSNGFVFPDSDQRELTINEIEEVLSQYDTRKMKEKVMQYAINEMEARYGYEFSANPEYQTYISQFGWYQDVYTPGKGHEEFEGVEDTNFTFLADYYNEHFEYVE